MEGEGERCERGHDGPRAIASAHVRKLVAEHQPQLVVRQVRNERTREHDRRASQPQDLRWDVGIDDAQLRWPKQTEACRGVRREVVNAVVHRSSLLQ